MKNKLESHKTPSPKWIVNVISGGEEINSVMYRAANKVSKVTITHEKWVWHVLEEESIIFDNADVNGLLTPHNDALVISLLVHDTYVKRVLIDPYSSVNIILLRVLHEMKTEDKLEPKAHTFSGFGNSRGDNAYYICRRGCQTCEISGGSDGKWLTICFSGDRGSTKWMQFHLPCTKLLNFHHYGE